MKRYVQRLQKKLRAKMLDIRKIEGSNVYTVEVPYYFDNGDAIRIYLKEYPDGWYLTDEGWTLWEINTRWATPEFFEQQNQLMIETICNIYNVKYKRGYHKKDGTYISAELRIECPKDLTDLPRLLNPVSEFTAVIMSLIQQQRHMRDNPPAKVTPT